VNSLFDWLFCEKMSDDLEAEIRKTILEMVMTGDLEKLNIKTIKQQLKDTLGDKIDIKQMKDFIVQATKEAVDQRNAHEQTNSGDNKEQHEEDDEEEEEEQEDYVAKGDGKKRKAAKSAAGASDAKKKKGAFGVYKISPELCEFLNYPQGTVISRTNVVKLITRYVKEHDLQDPSNRRNIRCDQTLKNLLGVSVVTFFSINKYLTRHFHEKGNLKDAVEIADDPNEKSKKSGGSKSSSSRGKKSPPLLSPELADVVGASSMDRFKVVKALWAYIKANNLQDPNYKRTIICDEKLQRLFGVDVVDMMKMSKLLGKHFHKADEVIVTRPKKGQQEEWNEPDEEQHDEDDGNDNAEDDHSQQDDPEEAESPQHQQTDEEELIH
jgi:upstream activation factor subunit UAF30